MKDEAVRVKSGDSDLKGNIFVAPAGGVVISDTSDASLWHTSGCNDALRAASRNCVTTPAGRETTFAI